MKTSLSFAVALGSLLALTGGPVVSGPVFSATIPQLFTPVTLPSDLVEKAKRQEALNPGIVQSRYVRINAKALDAIGPIGLDLFPDVYLTATRYRLDRRSVNRYSWFGRPETAGGGQIILAAEGGVMAGDIRTSSRVYHVAYVGNGVHAIWEVRDFFPDRGDFVPRCCAVIKDPPIVLPAIVDVMVVYTPAATTAAGGVDAMEAQIQLNLDWTNEAYRNSQIKEVLRLADAWEVNYTEAADISVRTFQALRELESPSDGVIDNVHGARDAVGADLVNLLCFHGCGIANLFDTLPTAAFSVSNWSASAGFAHEIGHNMGAGHARDDMAGGGAFPYSWGYTDPNGAWHDIMSYGAGCGYNCPTIQFFSNPNVSYNGTPTGRPDGSVDANGNPDSADNARTHNETAATVASFRQPPAMIGIPGTGATLTCCQLTFTAQSRANAEYFWMFGTHRNFADVAPSWVGTGTTRSVNVTLPATMSGQTLWVRLYTRIGGPAGTLYHRDHTYSIQ